MPSMNKPTNLNRFIKDVAYVLLAMATDLTGEARYEGAILGDQLAVELPEMRERGLAIARAARDRSPDLAALCYQLATDLCDIVENGLAEPECCAE